MNHEDGVIAGRQSQLRYDVQIPGRAWPWDGVGTLGPQQFENGEAVKLGFIDRNRQIPFILTQKPWPSAVRGVAAAAIPEGRRWTHYLQSSSRMGSSPWDLVDLRRYASLVPSVGGDLRLTRVLGDLLYVDRLGGLISKVDPSTGAILGSWLTGFSPIDLVVDDHAIYSVGQSGGAYVLKKCDPETMTTSWSTSLGTAPIHPSGTAPYVPFSWSIWRAGSRVGCISTKIHESLPRRVMYLHSLDEATGGSPTVVPLYQSEEPSFGGEIARRPLVSSRMTGTDSNLRICQWPASFDPEPVYKTSTLGSASGRPVSPWVNVGDTSETTYSPIAFPAYPQELAAVNQLQWGTTQIQADESSDEGFTTPRLPDRIITTLGSPGQVSSPDRIIPRAKWTPTLVAYNSDGSTAWEVPGWINVPVPGDADHARKFFTPLLSDRNGRIAVIARHVRFVDLSLYWGAYTYESGEVYDDSVIPPRHMSSWQEHTLVGEREYRARVVISTEDYLEIYSPGGTLLSSVPLTEDKVRSMVHFPTGHAPAGRGRTEQSQYPDPYVPPPTPPLTRTTRSDWYTQPWLSPGHGSASASDGSAFWYSPVVAGSGNYQWTFGDGQAVHIYQDGKARLDGHRVGDIHEWDCEERQTTVDAPLLFDKFSPLLSTDRTKIIFPQKSWSGAMFDGAGNMRLTNARRSWDAATANPYLENVVLGGDYRLGEKRWLYAFDWLGGGVVWRHEIPFPAGSSVSFAAPACGGGRLYQIYRVGSTTRMRVINDTNGELIEDFVPSNPGYQSGSIGTNSHVILCGGVSVLVSNGAIVAIQPEG